MKTVWLRRGGFLCLFLCLLSFVILVTINNPWLYNFDAQRYGLAESVGLSHEALLKNFHQLMNYLNFPWIKTLEMTDFLVSASGALHFYEVKRLFLLDYAVFLVTLVPSLFFVRNLVKTKSLWRLVQPFQLAIILPIIFGLVMLIGFDTFFVKFHELFFNNDAWIFNPVTDPVIWVLPEEFFMHCFILFFVLLESVFLVFYWLGRKSIGKK